MRLPLILLLTTAVLPAAEPLIMPMPAQYSAQPGQLTIDQTFRVALTGSIDPRVQLAAIRLIKQMERQTGMLLDERIADPRNATFILDCGGPGKPVQELGEDESYRLV